MKLYSVFLGFGFMLLAGASTDVRQCTDKSTEMPCLFYDQYGLMYTGTICSPGGEGSRCHGATNCGRGNQ